MAKLNADVLITPKMMRDREFTITANVRVRYHWRVRVALFLLRLAGRIGGITVKEDGETGV